ncbi:MAG: DUF3467 domain-containing protein [Prevotella sp.]|nr:DUF3467 domain-containing protein [Prevotella sp.]
MWRLGKLLLLLQQQKQKSVLPGVPKAQVCSRIILAPEHAKRLLGALQENVMRYEKEFGPIRIPNQEPRTIAPFKIPEGEA